jgi:prepilin-type N-terminal cleavage/methylation domain-containing protein
MSKKGFTLIELSIVLTIIGLMIGGSFKMMKMMREKAKTQEAKEQVLAAKNAVMGYALEYVDLPTAPEFKDILSPSKDENHPVMYVVDSNLANDYDICAFKSTNLKVDVNTSIAFIIVHEGANYNMQTDLSANPIKIYPPSKEIGKNGSSSGLQESYDDIVEWVTLEQLQKEVGCANKPFRFATDKLPNAKVGVHYPDINTSTLAELKVENNISSVVLNCLPNSQYGINFTNPAFSGTPTESGVAWFECTAAETPPSDRNITKAFPITIDPNYNKETNATCTSDAECGGGICVVGYGCQTGAFDVRCVDGGDCKSGICYGGFCGGAIGSACSSSTQCLSGYCDGILCALMPSGDGNSTETCKTEGQSCQTNGECCSGLSCKNGVWVGKQCEN